MKKSCWSCVYYPIAPRTKCRKGYISMFPDGGEACIDFRRDEEGTDEIVAREEGMLKKVLTLT